MNMTNDIILRIAMEQSAIDANCRPEDFLRDESVIAISQPNPAARKYLKLPHACNLISYGGNVVATISEEYREIVSSYISKYPAMRCFETPNLHVLNDAFQRHGFRACFMAEYFLPDMRLLKALPCDYEERILTAANFGNINKKFSVKKDGVPLWRAILTGKEGRDAERVQMNYGKLMKARKGQA